MKYNRTGASLYNLLFNYVNTLLGVVYGIVLVPFYLTYFDISTYGAWLASGNVIAIMGIFDLGMNLVFAQKLASSIGAKSWQEYSKIYSAGIFISIILILIVSLCGWIISSYVPHLVNAKTTDYNVIKYSFIIAALSGGCTILFQNMAAGLQALMESKVLGIITSVSLILGIVVTVVCVYKGYGVMSIPLGVLIRNIVSIILTGIQTIKIWNRNKISFVRLEMSYVKALLRAILPIFFSRSITMILQNNQLIIVANVLGADSAAIYNITGKSIATIGSFIMPVASSVFASFSQLHGEGDKGKVLVVTKKVMDIVTVVLCIAIGGCIFLNEIFIGLWVGNKNYGGDLLTTLIGVTFIFMVRSNILNTFLLAFGNQVSTSVANLAASVVQFLIIVIFINSVGIIIIPLSELISIIVVRFPVLINEYKKYFMISLSKSFQLNISGYELIVPLLFISVLLQSLILNLTIYNFLICLLCWFLALGIIIMNLAPYKYIVSDLLKRFIPTSS